MVRPYGDYYQVLGEAYVQGLMDGEAITALESGQHATLPSGRKGSSRIVSKPH